MQITRLLAGWRLTSLLQHRTQCLQLTHLTMIRSSAEDHSHSNPDWSGSGAVCCCKTVKLCWDDDAG